MWKKKFISENPEGMVGNKCRSKLKVAVMKWGVKKCSRGRLKKEDGTGWIKIRLNYGAYKNKKKCAQMISQELLGVIPIIGSL